MNMQQPQDQHQAHSLHHSLITAGGSSSSSSSSEQQLCRTQSGVAAHPLCEIACNHHIHMTTYQHSTNFIIFVVAVNCMCQSQQARTSDDERRVRQGQTTSLLQGRVINSPGMHI